MARNHVVDGNVMRFSVYGAKGNEDQFVSCHYASWDNAYHYFRSLASFCQWYFVRLCVDKRDGCFDVWKTSCSWEYCRAEHIIGTKSYLITYDYYAEKGYPLSVVRRYTHD